MTIRNVEARLPNAFIPVNDARAMWHHGFRIGALAMAAAVAVMILIAKVMM